MSFDWSIEREIALFQVGLLFSVPSVRELVCSLRGPARALDFSGRVQECGLGRCERVFRLGARAWCVPKKQEKN